MAKRGKLFEPQPTNGWLEVLTTWARLAASSVSASNSSTLASRSRLRQARRTDWWLSLHVRLAGEHLLLRFLQPSPERRAKGVLQIQQRRDQARQACRSASVRHKFARIAALNRSQRISSARQINGCFK
jgi:hypothetical protein